MTMTAAVHQLRRRRINLVARLLPDFLWTKVFTEKVRVRILQEVVINDGYYRLGEGISSPPMRICSAVGVSTTHGMLNLLVSGDVYQLLRLGDSLIIRYQEGRRTGTLKGHIAR